MDARMNIQDALGLGIGEHSDAPVLIQQGHQLQPCKLDSTPSVQCVPLCFPGDAHIIRNAGGRVSDDALRSLAVSQLLLGTKEVYVIHHTKCGMDGLCAPS